MTTDLRTIEGFVQLPDDTPAGWGDAVVELRDVSVLDAPSQLIASVRLPRARLSPGARLAFMLRAPARPAGASLGLRVQLQAQTASGHPSLYLTTAACPVPASGDAHDLRAQLTRVSG